CRARGSHRGRSRPRSRPGSCTGAFRLMRTHGPIRWRMIRRRSPLEACSSNRNARPAAYDGGGTTEIGAGEYPRPPPLRSMDVASMSYGEIFYHIRNGIRNTGMPAWQLPEREIWQLVAFIRHLPDVAPLAPGQGTIGENSAAASAPVCGVMIQGG